MSFFCVYVCDGYSDPRMSSRHGHKAAQSHCELTPLTCINLTFCDKYTAYGCRYGMCFYLCVLFDLSVILNRRAGCMQTVSRKWEPEQADAEKKGLSSCLKTHHNATACLFSVSEAFRACMCEKM